MFKVFFRYYDGSFIKEFNVYFLSIHKSPDMFIQTIYFHFWDICESCD